MKLTNANIINFVKGTKGAEEFTVISFDKETGKRVHGYGGYNVLDAFCEMTRWLSQGYDVVLTDKRGADYMFECEVRNPKNGKLFDRVTYSEMLPYSIEFSAYSWKKCQH